MVKYLAWYSYHPLLGQVTLWQKCFFISKVAYTLLKWRKVVEKSSLRTQLGALVHCYSINYCTTAHYLSLKAYMHLVGYSNYLIYLWVVRYALDSLWQLIVRTNEFFDFSLDPMWQTTEYLQSSPNTGRMNFMKIWRLLMYVYTTSVSLVSCIQKASRVECQSIPAIKPQLTCHGHMSWTSKSTSPSKLSLTVDWHLSQKSFGSIHAIKSIDTCEWVDTLPTIANRWLSCWLGINQDVNGLSMESWSRAVINTWTQMHLVHLIASL